MMCVKTKTRKRKKDNAENSGLKMKIEIENSGYQIENSRENSLRENSENSGYQKLAILS